MIHNMPRVLIENWLPIEAIGVESLRNAGTYCWYSKCTAAGSAGSAQKALRVLLAAE